MNTEGVRAKGPGRWEVRVTHNGRRYSKVVRTKLVSEAVRERDAFIRELERGKGTGDLMPLSALLEEWFDAFKGEWSPHTSHGYRWRIDKHIVPEIGNVTLRRLGPADLDRFYSKLRQTRKPTSVRQYHAILRRALGQAVKWGYIDSNPASRATPPSVVASQVEAPTVEAVQALIAQAEKHSPDLLNFLTLAAMTGARRGELCALRVTSLTKNRKGESALKIERSIWEIGKEVGEKGTKTHQAREVLLDEAGVKLVEAQVAFMKDRAEENGAKLLPDAYLYSHDLNGHRPWRPDYVTTAVTRLRKKTGARIKLHDLRHFQASMLLAAGVPYQTVQKRLGHANAYTTLKIYAHSTDEADASAAKVAGALLTPKETA